MNGSATALFVLLTFVSPVAAQTRVFVYHACGPPCSQAETVSAIDAATNKIVTTIHIDPSGVAGADAGRTLAATPDGKRLYLTGGNVSVIDTATNQVIAKINDIPAANSIAISPDGLRAYVGSGFGFIGVINTLTNKIIVYINRPDNFTANGPFSLSGQLAITPDGKRLYTTRFLPLGTPSSIEVIDTAINMVVDHGSQAQSEVSSSILSRAR